MENQKKRSRKGLIIIAVILCLALTAGTGMVFWNRQASSPEAFDAYIDELFKGTIAKNTINLHYTLAYPENYGITDYEITLGNYSTENLENAYKECENVQRQLLKFDRERLSDEQKLTYDIIMDNMETEIGAKDFVYYEEMLGPLTGYQVQIPIFLAEYDFRREKDIEDYLILLSQMDEMFEKVIEFEEKKAEEGLFMADYVADEVIAQCRDFVSDPEENYMTAIFDDKIDAFQGLTGEQKKNYKEKNRKIIATDVADAYKILIEGLERLKGRGNNDLGLCYYDRGKEYYIYLIRNQVGTDDSVKKLEKRIGDFITGRIEEIQDIMEEDPAAYEEYADFVCPITEPEEIMKDLMIKLEKNFPDPPRVNYTIRYVHPSMQEHTSPAFYLPTPVDDTQNNYLYINEKYIGNDLYPTMAHEGYPGHLYQNAFCNDHGVTPIRNLFSYSGYQEGWAAYVQFEYAYDYMGLSPKAADIASGNTAISLGLQAYLDLAVHYEGWDREKTAEFFAGFGIDEETADEAFEAVIKEPGNYLNYFIGYLEILDLREKARKALGDDFKEKEFHRFILETGSAPFYIIENRMDDWIMQQQ